MKRKKIDDLFAACDFAVQAETIASLISTFRSTTLRKMRLEAAATQRRRDFERLRDLDDKVGLALTTFDELAASIKAKAEKAAKEAAKREIDAK